jgi:hypothetical protein
MSAAYPRKGIGDLEQPNPGSGAAPGQHVSHPDGPKRPGGKVLACSTTATLKKVRGDAEKIKQHFKGITKLVFATPATVSNKRGEANGTLTLFKKPLSRGVGSCQSPSTT